MRKIIWLLLLSSTALAQTREKNFEESTTPEPPDYSKSNCWAALPDKKDFADMVPSQCKIKDAQANAAVDVFFIYPTIFTKKPTGPNYWNADVYDEAMNKSIDESSVKYQSTAFNAAGRVYVPRYRQAHFRSYLTSDKASAKKAFDTAYADVKAAFEYYMKYYNNGRPIIIAGHSQGTHHAIHLLKDLFDNSTLRNQLVAAYLVGGDVHASDFEILKPCPDSSSTGCYVSWRTYSTDFVPKQTPKTNETLQCTNPLSWKNDTAYAQRNLNAGAVLKDFDKIVEGVCDAQVDQLGLLRINKPQVRGRVFINYKSYHKADYNLFYMNVRINAILRADEFMQKVKK